MCRGRQEQGRGTGGGEERGDLRARMVQVQTGVDATGMP